MLLPSKIEDIQQLTQTEESCLKFLAEYKWKDGFICKKCGHTNYCEGKKPFSRRCTKCKHDESAQAHTNFHGCKIPLPKAFNIAYTICHSEAISTHELSRKLDLRQMTCWKFKKKITECIDKRTDIPTNEKEKLKAIILGN